MAAAAMEVMANSLIVSTILHHLSDMKYKDRRQYGPDQPVEFLEFRPTLVPSILVNRLWADEGISILWKRYPHLPALRTMEPARRQYYANKVHQIFTMSPERLESLDHLDHLEWPNLKSLELEVDLYRHGAKLSSMMHPGLEHLEISGVQSGGSAHFVDVVFPSLLAPCQNLKSIRFAPESVSGGHLLHANDLYTYLASVPSIISIEIKATNISDKDFLFTRLSQRNGLEGLEIDLPPGRALLPQLTGPNSPPSSFSSLKRLTIMCYPEIALALPSHLGLIEELQIEICRIPDQPTQASDFTVIENLLAELSHCPHLRLLKIGIGATSIGFPSFRSLPKVGGAALVNLSAACPKLEDINLFSADPSALDGSGISRAHFDAFCKNLPLLRNLSLKLHPATVLALDESALQILGKSCRKLEILRLKLPFRLPSLPVPSTIPEILIIDESAVNTPQDAHDPDSERKTSNADFGMSDLVIDTSPRSHVPPLFPRLVHLAISRPETRLSAVNDRFTTSSDSTDGALSDVVDDELEEELVRTWAHPLLTHFPRLEILEAWGDWIGQDNESLNYFLPTEEILASTWEFLSGTEQDLWDDEEEDLAGRDSRDSWQTHGSEDWDVASYMNEFNDMDEKLRPFEEEPDGMITPGRTHDTDEFFEHPDIQYDFEPADDLKYQWSQTC